MYGFQPKHARGKPVQNFADGGIVHSITGMLGMRKRTPEEMLAADAKVQERNREAAARVAARAKPAQQAAPAEEKAVSSYAGMSAMQRREKELGLKDGGRVEPRGFVSGKGTGTSDSIKARLSNGEYVLPADTVKAVGVEALDALRAATHTPVKHEQAKAAHGFFAGGTPGGLDEEKLKNSFGDAAAVARSPGVTQVGGLANDGGASANRIAQVPAPIGTQPGRTPEPAAQPAAPAAAKDPLDGGAVFGMYPQLAGGQRTTYATDAKLRTGVQASGPSTFAPATPSERTIIGGGNGQRMNAAQDPRSLTYGATAGNDTEAPVAPAAPNPTDQRIAAGAQQAPAAATQPASAMVAPGAYRNAPGQYSDNAAGMAMPAGFTGQPSAQNMAAADALAARQTPAGFQPAGSQPASVQAPVVRNSTNDWAARRALENMATAASSITNTRRWGGKGAKNSQDVQAYQAALKNDMALQLAQPGMDKAAMDANAALQREGIQQAGATARDAGRTALAGEELGLKRTAAGFQTRALQQQEQLRNTLIDPKATPEQRKQAQEYLQALAISGKEPSPQYKSYVMPAIRNADGSTTEGGVYQENTRTGEGRWVKPQGDGNSNGGQQQNFENKQIYKDANGNERRYNNGVWEKV